MRIWNALICLLLVAALVPSVSLAKRASAGDNGKVVQLTRFLEVQPFHDDAPAVRAWLIEWEDKSKDVIDYVCPGVLAPIPDDAIPYSGELLVQFIFGSAAHQIANPSDKGQLMAGQLAGMRSMLKTYQTILAQRPDAAIPRLDELSQKEANATLPQYLETLVAAECEQ